MACGLTRTSASVAAVGQFDDEPAAADPGLDLALPARTAVAPAPALRGRCRPRSTRPPCPAKHRPRWPSAWRWPRRGRWRSGGRRRWSSAPTRWPIWTASRWASRARTNARCSNCGSMRGHKVLFHTAVAVVRAGTGFEKAALNSVAVSFRALDDDEIEHYLRTEQPYDCAGSAKCETLGHRAAQRHRVRRPDRTGRAAADPHQRAAAPGRHRPAATRSMSAGRLLLVPNTLDLGAEPVDIQQLLPLGVLQCAARLGHWLAEDARSTRAFLKRVDAVVPLASRCRPSTSASCHVRPRAALRPATVPWRELLAPALAGQDLGLISEAGLPAVADPGAAAVAAAHAQGIEVRAAARRQLAAAGAGGQRAERPELRLRRLPAAGRRRPQRAAEGAAGAVAAQRADAAADRNALPQCRACCRRCWTRWPTTRGCR